MNDMRASCPRPSARASESAVRIRCHRTLSDRMLLGTLIVLDHCLLDWELLDHLFVGSLSSEL